ncbi:MAG: M1 family aminopeptidase [Anaerolineae bacterium]|nr:M1 family aminopeptidase [Anaerolineae bacterium]
MQAPRRAVQVRLVLGIIVISLFSGCSMAGAVDQGDPVAASSALSPPTATVPAATPTLAVEPSPTAAPEPTPTIPLFSGQPSIGDPFTPDLGNTGYDVQHYELDLALDPAARHVEGSTTIQAVTTEESLRQVSFDFIGYEIGAVTVDGTPANYRREDGKLWLEFPQPLMTAGSPFTVTVYYGGTPEEVDSPYIHYADYLGLVFLPNNTFYTISEPDGARYWFPANDHPLDKATFRTRYTVPRGIAAIGNGQLVDSELSTMPDGSDGTTFIWELDAPMATYLVLAAGGHYTRVTDEAPNGVPLVFYYFPEMEEEYLDAVDVTGEAMVWLSERLGPYPFASYGQATYYAMGISMEMQAMTLLSYQMLDETTVVHELVHCWFGNWVGIDSWGDTWRKEGLATYLELLWRTRNNPAELDTLIAEIEEEVAEKGNSYPLDLPPQHRIMSFDSYSRGALLMSALHQEVGDEAFFAGLRLYIENHGGESSDHEAFQAALESASGKSLQDFFARWLAHP